MKNFNEWREGVTQHENPDMLIERLDDLAHKLEIELEAFEGERFEGFLTATGISSTWKITPTDTH